MKMTNITKLALIVLPFIFWTGRPALAEEQPAAPAVAQPAPAAQGTQQPKVEKKQQKTDQELVVADFDTGDKPNNIGGDFGAWDKDPNDDTQGTEMAFEPDDALGDPAGYSIRLDYDVDSPNPAYNGFWMKLNGEDVSKYNAIRFYIKGDAKAGFTKRVKIELKDMSNKPSPYIVTGITEQWQAITIPFDKFRRIQSWNGINEFVVVFDDINSNPKKGTIYLDQVSFVKQ